MEVQARKFYSQRNMYLCGFTLFLSLILNRTYVLILDVLKLEETVKALRKDSNDKVKDGALESTELKKLKEQLAASERDKEALLKQSDGLHREYGSLSDKFNALEKQGRNEVRKDL